ALRSISPDHLLEVTLPFHRDYLGADMQLDGIVLFDPADEVARHGLSQSARANEHVYSPDRFRQEDGCLASGIPTANDNDLLITAKGRLHGCGGVVDADAIEASRVVERQLPVFGARCDNDRSRSYLRTRVEPDSERPVLAAQPRRRLRHHDLRTEL